MADYTKITDFAVKDSLLTGNPLKLITGTAHDNEYNAIAVAIATKVDETSGTLTNGTLVNTALGTPPSGTLTNCTGLPLAGVTDSTTEALGVGSLELGHATDTTLTRASAGVVAIEGVNVLTTATGAALAGSASQTFSVATATLAAHAVRKDQFDAGVAGSVIQTVSASYSTQTATTSATLVDTGLTATITPKYATSKILVIVSQTATIPDASTAAFVHVAVLRDASLIWQDQRVGGTAPAAGSNFHDTPSCSVLDSPATTSATTYKTQIASGSAGQSVQAQHAGLRTSTITLMEIAQ